MATATDTPQNSAERLISRAIQATWLLWLLGALYIAGPVLGWTLALMAGWRLYAGPALPGAQPPARVDPIVVLWIVGMTGMLAVLLVGHALNDLDAGQTIKSATGWAKGWALLAVFPFAGAVLDVRPAIVYRAICKLGLQTLLLMPIFLLAPMLHLPPLLYTSPLQVLGGSGPEFFTVPLYTVDPEFHVPRWQFFAPWSPAAGMVAVVHILCAIEDRNIRWRSAGIVAGIAIAYFTQSRLALVAIVIVWPLVHLVARLRLPKVWFVAAPAMLVLGLLGPAVLDAKDRAVDGFNGARADSSRVRATLGRIAVERWRNEAPWFGHGIVERGPHIAEYMPIGSHHSWYGLLFVKGFLGLASLAVPMAWSIVAMTWRTIRNAPNARIGLSMLLVLLLYSFGENLEVLGYLIWPALLLIGVAARPEKRVNTNLR